MVEISINFANHDQLRYIAGDRLSGTVDLTLPEDVPIGNVSISFHCLGQVRWVEYVNSPFYQDGYVYYDDFEYHREEFRFEEKDAKVEPHMSFQKVAIPFWFDIPKDKNLPSTMVSNHGSIQYFVQVHIKLPDTSEVSKAKKEIIVQSPIEDNLLVSVGGTVEKNVLLHGGNVLMHATINRKGHAPGESISVHVLVDNKSNATIRPRVTLHQIQIFMCGGSRHKTIENQLTEEAVPGKEIPPLSEEHQLISIEVPKDEALTIKSHVITVKYFVRVVLDIPQAFDLQLNLPVVLTSKRILEQLQKEKAEEEKLAMI